MSKIARCLCFYFLFFLQRTRKSLRVASCGLLYTRLNHQYPRTSLLGIRGQRLYFMCVLMICMLYFSIYTWVLHCCFTSLHMILVSGNTNLLGKASNSLYLKVINDTAITVTCTDPPATKADYRRHCFIKLPTWLTQRVYKTNKRSQLGKRCFIWSIGVTVVLLLNISVCHWVGRNSLI